FSDKSISILAPARGATNTHINSNRDSRISILAPARGATRYSSIIRQTVKNFNPRSREGSDAQDRAGSGLEEFQSSLPRGERRRLGRIRRSTWRDFNPRSREGSDEYR